MDNPNFTRMNDTAKQMNDTT